MKEAKEALVKAITANANAAAEAADKSMEAGTGISWNVVSQQCTQAAQNAANALAILHNIEPSRQTATVSFDDPIAQVKARAAEDRDIAEASAKCAEA